MAVAYGFSFDVFDRFREFFLFVGRVMTLCALLELEVELSLDKKLTVFACHWTPTFSIDEVGGFYHRPWVAYFCTAAVVAT